MDYFLHYVAAVMRKYPGVMLGFVSRQWLQFNSLEKHLQSTKGFPKETKKYDGNTIKNKN